MIIRTSTQTSSISDLLESSSKLSELRDHIEQLGRLQTKLCDYLDPPLNEHVIVADYRQETLFLHTDSSAWTETIRYLTPEILALFRDELPGIRTVRIKNPPVRPPAQAARRAAGVSPDTAQAIRQTADEITDASLRSVLLRIADKLLAGSGRE